MSGGEFGSSEAGRLVVRFRSAGKEGDSAVSICSEIVGEPGVSIDNECVWRRGVMTYRLQPLRDTDRQRRSQIKTFLGLLYCG